MEANFTVAFDIADLETVRFYDTTNYGTSSPSNVGAVRFLSATVNSVYGASQNVTDLKAWNQYVVLRGSVTINGKVYSGGDYIYLSQDVTIPSQGVLVAYTGFYGGRTTWLPKDGTFVEFTPSQMIYNDNSIIFPDNVFTTQYELYGAKISTNQSLPTNTVQCIVVGSLRNSIEYDGAIYYVGEVFTTSGTTNFTDNQGVNYVCPLVSDYTGYFRTWYQNWTIWGKYFNEIATSYQTTAEFNADFVAVTARINQQAMFEEQQFGVSLVGINDLLQDVIQNYDFGVL
jgi:hypothetical protein